MAEDRSESDKLIEGIAEEARREAEKITSEAELQASEIVEGAEKRGKQIVEEAEERGEEQAEAIRAGNRQTIDAERRRSRLKAEERIFSRAYDMIHRRLEELRRSDEYPGILKGWIVEGALGLGVEKAEVNAPEEERRLITGELLSEAEEEVRAHGGEVSLSLSQNQPIRGQGVVVDEAGGRLSFNNRVEARLQRYAAEIRRMIYGKIQEEPE